MKQIEERVSRSFIFLSVGIESMDNDKMVMFKLTFNARTSRCKWSRASFLSFRVTSHTVNGPWCGSRLCIRYCSILTKQMKLFKQPEDGILISCSSFIGRRQQMILNDWQRIWDWQLFCWCSSNYGSFTKVSQLFNSFKSSGNRHNYDDLTWFDNIFNLHKPSVFTRINDWLRNKSDWKVGRIWRPQRDFPKSLHQSFSSNLEKYQKHARAMHSCKQQMKSGQIEMEKTKRFEESQVRNLQGILLRSTTTGVWLDPSSSYIKRKSTGGSISLAHWKEWDKTSLPLPIWKSLWPWIISCSGSPAEAMSEDGKSALHK